MARTRSPFPFIRTANPWYQLDRDRIFAYGANMTEKIWDIQILNATYAQDHYRETVECACGKIAWMRETVGAFTCEARHLPLHARSLDKIEAEAKITTDTARLADLRIEWRNARRYNYAH